MRFMVTWHRQAEEDLARHWLDSRIRARVVEASWDIERRIRFDPERAGDPVATEELEAAARTVLADRIPLFPVELRRVRCGVLDAFVTIDAGDCAVRVWMIRRVPDS